MDREDPDFLRQQEEYRAMDRAARRVDTHYAEPLGKVVDNASDAARINQLAADFCGVYGSYRVQLVGREVSGAVVLSGAILSGDDRIGVIRWRFHRDRGGNLVAHLGGMRFYDASFRDNGLFKALSWELERYYWRSGVDRTEMLATRDDASALVRLGFTWDPDPLRMQRSLDSIKKAARRLSARVGDQAKDALQEIAQRLDPHRPDLPELIELVNLNTCDEPDLGRQLLHGAGVRAVKYHWPPYGMAGVTDESILADVHTASAAKVDELAGDLRAPPGSLALARRRTVATSICTDETTPGGDGR